MSKNLLGLLFCTLTVGIVACGAEPSEETDAWLADRQEELRLPGCANDGEVAKVFDLCAFGAGSQWAPRCFAPGSYELSGAINDDISSIQVQPGYQVKLHDGAGSSSPLVTATGNLDVCGQSANDKASKLVISALGGGSGGGASGGATSAGAGGSTTGGAQDSESSEPVEVGSDPPVSVSINGGNVTIHPSDDPPVLQSGRFFAQGNKPFYLAGVGGPEGFAFESSARKQQIVDKLKARGVHGIYFHLTRAFGGDGKSNGDEHLFKSSADKRLDAGRMQSLAAFMDQLDQAGILMWTTLLDDHSKPWGCYSAQNAAQYQTFAKDLARAFKGYKHLIWVTKEEYDWSDCSHAQNVDLVKNLAAAIRSQDRVHAIATHHMNGDGFDFDGDPNIKVFGQQTGDDGEGDSVDRMHDVSGVEGWNSGAAYVMSEAHPYHKDLIRAGKSAELRQSLWATAFSGGSVLMYDAYECHDPRSYGNGAWLCTGPNAGNSPAQPKPEMLDALRRLRRFMSSVRYPETTPLFGAALGARRSAGTRWLLVNDAKGIYVLYGSSTASALGVTNVSSGTYVARWFDPVDGSPGALAGGTAFSHTGGTLTHNKPSGLGDEAVLYLVKQ